MHVTYHYDTWEDVKREAEAVGAFIPYESDTSVLFEKLEFGGHVSNNRIAFQPMEGADGELEGAPSELTRDKYIKFAKSGVGLIWFEAVACAHEARASARQLMITDKNVDAFSRLTDEMREVCLKENGFEPIIVMQATHSGRYAKPNNTPEPLIAYNNPMWEKEPIDQSRILTDDQLKYYESRFSDMARLAQKAGFDGMDVKCCHGYLANELMSAYNRKGEYGGSFENRSRFLLNAFAAAQSAVNKEGFFLTSRLGAHDGFPYPWGFGVKDGEGIKPALEEAIELIGIIKKRFNIPILNITIGNPYQNPHVNRPYDKGNYVPNEHPFTGLSRMMTSVSELQNAYPDLPIIGSAFSYLRTLSPNMAAGMIAQKRCAMAGFGRLALRYPDFVKEIRETGTIDKKHICLTCGQCAKMLRACENSMCIFNKH